MASIFPPSHKRKETDNDDQLAFNHVSFSPPKKFRQMLELQVNDLPTIFEEAPVYNMPDNQHAEIELPPVQVTELIDIPEESDVSLADERAIVLYKPVESPLFPGGPVAGSDDLSIRVDARFFGAYKSLSNLARPYGSLPYSSSSILDETLKSTMVSNNNLAMIPWVPPSAHSTATGIQLDASSGVNKEDTDEMLMDDGEAMDQETVAKDSVSTSPVLGFSAEPWQQFGVPQPANIPAMWLQ